MSADWRSFARFLFAGGVNTGFGYASFAMLILAGMPKGWAVTGSTLLAIVFNFFSYGGLVFGSTAKRYLPRFLLFYTALGLFNYGTLEALTAVGLGPLIAQAILVPALALIGYSGMRVFVFVGTAAGKADGPTLPVDQ